MMWLLEDFHEKWNFFYPQLCSPCSSSALSLWVYVAESLSDDLDFLVHKHCFFLVQKGDAKEGCWLHVISVRCSDTGLLHTLLIDEIR